MKKLIQGTLMIGLFSLTLTSCLKDKENEAGKIGLQDPEKAGIKIVEMLGADHSPATFALNTAPAQEVIDAVTVNLATATPATEDVKVTLVKDVSIIADYNTANSTTYIELPSNAYTQPTGGLVVTIPAGSNSASLKLNLIKSNFDFTKAYALAYKIASVSPTGYTISGNFNKLMINIGLKNKYDGAYKLTGYHNRTPYDFPYVNVDMQMHTSGQSNVKFYFVDAGSFGHPIGTGPGAISWYGAAIAPELTVDAATNNITSAQNTGGATVIDLDPTNTTNRVTWNASANRPDKIYVTWRYNANQLRRFFDTLTYVGPR